MKKDFTPEQVKIMTRSGYFKRYFVLRAEHKSNKAAFLALEGEVYEMCGVNRFDDYASFRNAKARWIKRGVKREF